MGNTGRDGVTVNGASDAVTYADIIIKFLRKGHATLRMA